MASVTMHDGAEIYYKDWGIGAPVVFLHGWPLDADAWDDQLVAVAEAGYRGIAPDRRGHGRSTQTWHGNDMDTWADDLAQLVEALDLHDITFVAHSMAGGELARYIGRHGTARVVRAVLLGAVPPLMLRTETNPEGLPIDALDAVRQGLRADRAEFWRTLADRFFSTGGEDDDPEGRVSQGLKDAFWFMAMHQSLKAAVACVGEYAETDFTEELRRFDIPTLLVHGDDDRMVPLAATAEKAVGIIPDATLKIYPGASHGLALVPGTKERFTEDLLAFLRG
ncbi:alpha/beta fold hydrolase [Streptomyces avicenniae]|uniref:alpha/beta fold hydrolase n=1 Tax=Streptomyces avicenniae TaxID=500153 RepID=UPI00069C0588|nr:alpha/beta hydrolase [Streptomyces avicenniae]